MRTLLVFSLMFMAFAVMYSNAELMSLNSDQCGIEFDTERYPENLVCDNNGICVDMKCFGFKTCAGYNTDSINAGKKANELSGKVSKNLTGYVSFAASKTGYFAYKVQEIEKFLVNLFAPGSEFLKEIDIKFLNPWKETGFNVEVIYAKELLTPNYYTVAYNVYAKVCPN